MTSTRRTGLVRVLLTRQRGLVQSTALHDGEDCHAAVIPATGRGVFLPRAGVTAGAVGSGLAPRGGGDGDDPHAGIELEVAVGEFIEGAPVLEEHDLAVTLAAGLEPDTDLRQRGISNPLAVLVDAALAVSPADDKSALADVRKHGITITVMEEVGALARMLEQVDGLAVVTIFGSGNSDSRRHQQCG